jgi:ATP-dependent Clp protease protease subunit
VYPPIPVVYTNEPPPLGEDLRERLLERRIVLASGRLDDVAANELAARLMYLDGIADDPIELRYSCPDGELGAAVLLADTIDLLGVELRATASGSVGGPALLPFAVATRRLAHPHATFKLSEGELEIRGSATEIVAEAERHASLVADVHRRLADATGQLVSSIEADFAARRVLSADEARRYGLIDEICATRGPRLVL